LSVNSGPNRFVKSDSSKRCATALVSFSHFKKTFEAGQLKLKEMVCKNGRSASPSNIAKTNTKIVSAEEASAMALFPDLDCEVDEGESVLPVPSAKSGDSAPKRKESTEKPKAEAKEGDKKADDDDPLMCLGQVESTYSGSEKGDDEEGQVPILTKLHLVMPERAHLHRITLDKIHV
jgi:hypothetical protein